MKKIILQLLFCAFSIFAFAQNKFEALTLSNDFPQVNQSLNFSFNQKLSPLISEKNIDIVIYQYTTKSLIVKEPNIIKKGMLHEGKISIDNDATCLVFTFEGEKEKDVNGGNGFIIPIYNENKLPTKEYYKTAWKLKSFDEEYLFGLPKNKEKHLALLEESTKAYPSLKDEVTYFNSYFGVIESTNKAESKRIIQEELNGIEKREIISEDLYGLLINYYSFQKNKLKADSLKKARNEKYPNGAWMANQSFSKIMSEKDADKKVEAYNEYISKVSASANNEQMIKMAKKNIANAYEKENKADKAKEWSRGEDMAEKASSLNNDSWNMAEEGKDLKKAKAMSAEATMYAKAQALSPTTKKPDNISTKNWKRQNQSNYAMYADTYAFILYKLGEYKEGLPYAKVGAEFNKLKDAEYNERYAMLLEKAAPAAEAKKIIESMTESGKASANTKAALKSLFIKQNKSDKGFDAYVTKLEEKAKIEKLVTLKKSMINKPSPKFNLKDWDGNEVTLESLKGKVVVIDFWATWCGPCIASMPGMKLAQEKLNKRDDVKFLFVDTWESVDDKLKNAKEFMTKKNYPFYVLMDNENKMVGDFEVTGIPAKFILDKKGNIRFNASGYEGNTDALADEIMQMVELAGK